MTALVLAATDGPRPPVDHVARAVELLDRAEGQPYAQDRANDIAAAAVHAKLAEVLDARLAPVVEVDPMAPQ